MTSCNDADIQLALRWKTNKNNDVIFTGVRLVAKFSEHVAPPLHCFFRTTTKNDLLWGEGDDRMNEYKLKNTVCSYALPFLCEVLVFTILMSRT